MGTEDYYLKIKNLLVRKISIEIKDFVLFFKSHFIMVFTLCNI